MWTIRGEKIQVGDFVHWMSGGTWDGIVLDAIEKPSSRHNVKVKAINGKTFWLNDVEFYGMSKGQSKFALEKGFKG